MHEPLRQDPKMLYVKVWEAPVVVSHWLMALAVIVLGVSGYLIGDPPFSQTGDASASYSLGTIRFIHFLAGYVLSAAFLLRLYWGVVGNRFCRWTSMLPLRKQRWLAMGEEIKYLLRPKGAFHIYTGHAPLANLSYLVLYLGIFFSIVSGFTLYAQAQYSPLWRWVAGLAMPLFAGNLNVVHLLHHLALWFFALFLLIHLYLVLYTILVSRTTEVDTMLSGRKFVFEEDLSRYAE